MSECDRPTTHLQLWLRVGGMGWVGTGARQAYAPTAHHGRSLPPAVAAQVEKGEFTDSEINLILVIFHIAPTQVEKGEFTDSEIVVMLGENGTGKTTFIRMLAGMTPPDEGSTEEGEELPSFHVRWGRGGVPVRGDVGGCQCMGGVGGCGCMNAGAEGACAWGGCECVGA